MRAGRLLLIWLIAFVIVAPLIAPDDPMATDTANQLAPPSFDHLLGTDLLGRDVLSRALYGGQRTLLIAGAALLIALIPGVLIGVLGGFTAADRVLVVLINGVLAFPGLLLALVIMTLLGQGALPLILATGITQIAPCARITRAAVIAVRSSGYVEAARGLGASQFRLIVAHIAPNILLTVLAYTGVMFSYAVLNAAALSFLGLGGEPGIPEWGAMLNEGRQAFRLAPWIAFAPGVGITLTVILTNRAIRRLR